jgi:hypothetical protein
LLFVDVESERENVLYRQTFGGIRMRSTPVYEIPVKPAIEQTLNSHEFGDHVLTALRRLVENDLYLLIVNANERSLSHCLAVYLRSEFAELDVDCEYNRDGIDPKQLPHLNLYPDSQDEDAKTVFPDIIVHRRGSNENILVIEIKKNSNQTGRDTDLAKLRGYRRELGTALLYLSNLLWEKMEVCLMLCGSRYKPPLDLKWFSEAVSGDKPSGIFSG